MCKKHLGRKVRTMLGLAGFLLAIQCLSVSAAMAVVYVNSNATGAGDGSSWADAFTDFQAGIDAAVGGSEVWVVAGTYYPTSSPYVAGGTDRLLHFALKSGVAVYGGFVGSETSAGQRDFETNPTILSGDIGVLGDNTDNSYHVFFHDRDFGAAIDTTALLDGFVIRDGNANEVSGGIHSNGGGMYNHETSPTIQNCLFTSNSTDYTGFNVRGGGGMYNYYASPVINQCAFVNNTTGRHGGGILNSGGAPQILSSTFSGNTAPDGSGGGIYNSSSAVFTGCTINNSSAYQEGGGLCNISSSSVFTNCTFDSNVVTNGQAATAIFNSGGVPKFTNCTVTGTNSLSSTAMYSYNSSPVVTNSIFRTGAYQEIINNGGATTVTFSVVTSTTANPGTGNTEADPLLDAAGLQDNGGPVETVAIGVGGSAEDSGTATGAPVNDARGVARQTPPSIGAYELISYTVGGEVSGLASGNEIVLQNNDGDDKTITIDTLYTFSTAVENGKSYAVTVLTQPSGLTSQLCTAEGSGVINNSNVTDADVSCVNTYTVGGTISGIASGNSVVLQNNSGDDLTVSAGSGDFTFSTALADGSAYSVTVLTNPDTPNQVCTVSTGGGSIASEDVSSVSISCVTTTYTVGGTISGLAQGTEVVLQNNAADDLTLNNNDPFTFATAIDDGSIYLVTVLTNPESPNQTCTVSNESGTVNGDNVATISVSCTTNTYSIGGEVTGLANGNSLRVANDGVSKLLIGNGTYTLLNVTDGTTYSVTVTTQPDTPDQVCSVSNASGIVMGMPVTDINVNCVTTTYTVGGSVTGLAAGNEVVLQNNGGDNLTLNSNDIFTFVTAIDDGSSYTVTVLTDPISPEQTCTVSNESGTLAGGNVTNVSVVCVTTTYTVGGSVTGLAAGNRVVLQNNGGDDLIVDANGDFTFATAIDDESTYLITVLTDPTTPNQTCTVTNDSGTLAGDNVSTVNVNCVTNTYTVGGAVSGLFATNSVTLQNNNGDDLTVDANGNFTFATVLEDGSTYSVTVLTQPETIIQTCTVINGDSTLVGIDVNSVHVDCGNTFPWDMFLPAILNIKP
jgi:hypothetical protein